MHGDEIVAAGVDSDARRLYRLGGACALAFGIAYLLIFPVYASVGAPPAGGEAWLEHAAGRTTAWRAILGLSVLTDVLLVPIAIALYRALRGVHATTMLLATAFIGLFVVLDLAVTWPNFAALIALADDYATTTSEARRAADVAAAGYASAVLASTLEGVYSIGLLSIGLLLAGAVMLRGGLGRVTAWLGLGAGALGIVSVVGPLVAGALGTAVVVASVLTTAWALAVGWRLVRLGGTLIPATASPAADPGAATTG